MTPFFRQSLTRALCAAAWCVPGALWWATPMVGAQSTDHSWTVSLPGRGFICGNAFRDTGFRRALALKSAVARGEYADSLFSIAINPRMEVDSREQARQRLAAMGDPRAPRRRPSSQPVFDLPPLIVSP